jgi:CRISPR-associated protein Csd2
MESLQNKIDFAVIFSVKNANPNGDPLNGNRPRTNYDGLGEVSDVCIKRKIRNRLMDENQPIFVQSDDNRMEGDNYKSLRDRYDGELKITKEKPDEIKRKACKKWIDVRAFGQVFPYKGKKNSKSKRVEDEDVADSNDSGVSMGIRGPVSVHSAFSAAPIANRISSIQITKSVSNEGEGKKKQSDTMGMKHRVDHGLYVTYGAINPQLASKTGFNDQDAEHIHKALKTLFDNDSSSARPEGSMEVIAVIWWKHNAKHGQYSSAKVHQSLDVSPKDGVADPKDITDYSIRLKKLDGLKPEVFDPNDVVIG